MLQCRNKESITVVDNGETRYQIVLAKPATPADSLAAHELQHFVHEISGVVVPIVAEQTAGSGAKGLFIGCPPANMPSINLSTDGFAIATDSANVYFWGSAPKSALYAVYHFLEKYLNCRMLSPSAVDVPKQARVEIPQLVDVQNPSFRYRETLYLFPNASQRYADWHKLHNRNDLKNEWGMFVHTFQHLIPAKRYFKAHPEWFSEVNGRRIIDGQLCLSNPDVLEELCRNLEAEMLKRPEAHIWSVSQNDNECYCTCPRCRQLDSLYGAPSGTMLHFVNRIAQRYPTKTISTLAYQYTRRAPSGIKPLPNVNIMFCSIECQRQVPIADNTSEAGFRADMEHWCALTDNIFLWDYVVQFRNMLNPFPNLHVLQPNLQLFARSGVSMMFEQGTGFNMTEMMEWRTYLIAKLLWNVDVNVDSLRTDFMGRYYGKAAPYVCEYIDHMTQALLSSGDVLNIYGYPIDAVRGYLRPDRVVQYQQLFHKAYATVGTDSVYRDRIRFLELSLHFATLDLAMNEVSPELSFFTQNDGKSVLRPDMVQMVDRFVADCNRFGVRKLEEMGYPPEEFVANISNYIEKRTLPNLALGKKVAVSTQWSSTYDVGGPQALTDGKMGAQNYSHNWLGFYGEHLDAVVDLGSVQRISHVRADFYLYPLSWIFIPERVEFYASVDSVNWSRVGECSYKNGEDLTKFLIYKAITPELNVQARYVRVYAQSILTNPAWHRGYGNKSWIFVDEILVW